MTISIVQDEAAIRQLRESWSGLTGTEPNPAFSYEWFTSCIATLHADDEPYLFVSRADDEFIDGIAPLVKVRRGHTDWLEFAGATALYEPCALLARDDQVRRKLLTALAGSSMPVHLSRLGDSQAVSAKFQSGIWLSKRVAGTPVLELHDGWDAFMASLSAKRRSDLRRAARKAATYGTPAFTVEKPGTAATARFLEVAKRIEDRSWKGKNNTSLAKNPRLSSFFDSYCQKAAAEQELRLFFLHLGDTPVATAICIEADNAVWFLKIGYDEAYSRCSPGLLLLKEITAYCCHEKLSRIEHLGTPAPWLSPWTSHVRGHQAHVHYPINVKGAALFLQHAAKSAASRLIQWQRKQKSNQ